MRARAIRSTARQAAALLVTVAVLGSAVAGLAMHPPLTASGVLAPPRSTVLQDAAGTVSGIADAGKLASSPKTQVCSAITSGSTSARHSAPHAPHRAARVEISAAPKTDGAGSLSIIGAAPRLSTPASLRLAHLAGLRWALDHSSKASRTRGQPAAA